MPSAAEHIELGATASAEHAGLRLDQAAAELFPDYSRARLQKWIRGGELTVDGRVCKPTYRLLGGEALCQPPPNPRYRAMKLRITVPRLLA